MLTTGHCFTQYIPWI